VLQREALGTAAVMRAASPRPRGVAGTVGSCLILNLPRSVDGAIESLGAVLNVLSHALVLLAGSQPL
jgi:molybdopterin biosynthesis enzyme MoaB